MIELKKIRQEAEETMAMMSQCKTVEDIRALRRQGVCEKDIQIRLTEEDDMDYICLSQLSPETQFFAFRIDAVPDTCVDFPTYYISGDFFFDVFDEEEDESQAFLEDISLETLEDAYNNYVFKKGIRDILGLDIDVSLCPDGTVNMYISSKGCAYGNRYRGIPVSQIGETVGHYVQSTVDNAVWEAQHGEE